MAIAVIPKANQIQRQFADFPDIDQKFTSKDDFETAIQAAPRIPDGWMAWCAAERNWYQANKATGKAELITPDVSGKADLPDGIAVVGAVNNPSSNLIQISGFKVIYNKVLTPIPDGSVTLPNPPVAGQFTRKDAVYFDPETNTYSFVQGTGETTIPAPIVPAGTFRIADIVRYLDKPNSIIITPPINLISNGNLETIYSDKYFDGQWLSHNDAVRFGTGITTPGRVGYKINNKNLFTRQDQVQIVADATANNGQAIVFPKGAVQNEGWFTYGPYVYLENGPCTLVIGIKVDNNTSGDSGLHIQIARGDNYDTASNLYITAQQFTAVNTWQYFQIPFIARVGVSPDSTSRYEVRINPISNSVPLPANFTIDESIICPFPLTPDTISADQIETDDTHQFVTDAEKDTWNNKLDKVAKASDSEIFNATNDDKYITSAALNSYLQGYGIKMAGISIVPQADDQDLHQRGIEWRQNTDYGKIYFYSTGDGHSDQIFLAGDNGTPGDGGSASGWKFIKDVGPEDSMPVNSAIKGTTVQPIAGLNKGVEVLKLSIDNFNYMGSEVYHRGNIAKLQNDIGLSTAGGTPQKTNKAMPASVTAADGDLACSTALMSTPINHGYVMVLINGAEAQVGDGAKTAACYFSADNGTTAKNIDNITAGDKLYWLGTTAGFQLDNNDTIDFIYNG